MTSSIIPILRTSVVAFACVLAADAALASDWRRAHVRAVGLRAAEDAGVDLTCAPQRPGDAATNVIVVSYRVGKSHAWRAFTVPVDDHYAVGDEVIISIDGCQVAPLPGAAAPASAP